MFKLLLDANLSPITAEFLRTLKFGVKSLIEEGLYNLEDGEVIELAKREKRVTVTFDSDFSELWYFKEKGKIGIIHLRLKDQTVENVNLILKDLFVKSKLINKKTVNELIIVKEKSFRVIKGEEILAIF